MRTHFRDVLCMSVMVLQTSCAFYPAVSPDQSYANDCEMKTRKLTLENEQLGFFDCNQGSAEACLILVAGVPVATLAVSGSVVLLGNTLHWVEYHGRCETGFVSKTLSKF